MELLEKSLCADCANLIKITDDNEKIHFFCKKVGQVSGKTLMYKISLCPEFVNKAMPKRRIGRDE